MNLEICDNGHVPITYTYTGRNAKCPVCGEIELREDAEKELESVREELENLRDLVDELEPHIKIL